jgi:hypothetical protein
VCVCVCAFECVRALVCIGHSKRIDIMVYVFVCCVRVCNEVRGLGLRIWGAISYDVPSLSLPLSHAQLSRRLVVPVCALE